MTWPSTFAACVTGALLVGGLSACDAAAEPDRTAPVVVISSALPTTPVGLPTSACGAAYTVQIGDADPFGIGECAGIIPTKPLVVTVHLGDVVRATTHSGFGALRPDAAGIRLVAVRHGRAEYRAVAPGQVDLVAHRVSNCEDNEVTYAVPRGAIRQQALRIRRRAHRRHPILSSCAAVRVTVVD